jgi:quinolinate synthase
MALNSLEMLRNSLRDETGVIYIAEDTRVKALVPLQRMLDFKV